MSEANEMKSTHSFYEQIVWFFSQSKSALRVHGTDIIEFNHTNSGVCIPSIRIPFTFTYMNMSLLLRTRAQKMRVWISYSLYSVMKLS